MKLIKYMFAQFARFILRHEIEWVKANKEEIDIDDAIALIFKDTSY